jgi:excisionase family DNA binding protein
MRPADPSPAPWLTLSEAAAYAKLHPATLRRAIHRGHLIAFRAGCGRLVRLKHVHVDDWLEGVNTPEPIRPGGAR